MSAPLRMSSRIWFILSRISGSSRLSLSSLSSMICTFPFAAPFMIVGMMLSWMCFSSLSVSLHIRSCRFASKSRFGEGGAPKPVVVDKAPALSENKAEELLLALLVSDLTLVPVCNEKLRNTEITSPLLKKLYLRLNILYDEGRSVVDLVDLKKSHIRLQIDLTYIYGNSLTTSPFEFSNCTAFPKLCYVDGKIIIGKFIIGR